MAENGGISEARDGIDRRRLLRSAGIAAAGGVGIAAARAASAEAVTGDTGDVTAINVMDYGATGNGSTDDSAAIQSAINAAANTGSYVYFPAGTYICQSRISLNNNCSGLVGDANQFVQTTGSTRIPGTMLSFPTDLGTGTYAIDGPPDGTFAYKRIAHMIVTGPGGSNSSTMGTSPANMHGIKVTGQYTLDDVSVQYFKAGIRGSGDHIRLTNVRSQNNYYGFYYDATGSYEGNNTYIACFFGYNTFASFAISPNCSLIGDYFAQVHFGFSPYGIYKEATSGSGQISDSSVFDGCYWEMVGNSAIYDENQSCIMFGDVFLGSSCTGMKTGTYRISSRANDYTVVVGVLQNVRLLGRDNFLNPAAKGIFSCANVVDFAHEGAKQAIDNCVSADSPATPCRYMTVSGSLQVATVDYGGIRCRLLRNTGSGSIGVHDIVSHNGPQGCQPGTVQAPPAGVAITNAAHLEICVVGVSGPEVTVNLTPQLNTIPGFTWIKSGSIGSQGVPATGRLDATQPIGFTSVGSPVPIGATTTTVLLRGLE